MISADELHAAAAERTPALRVMSEAGAGREDCDEDAAAVGGRGVDPALRLRMELGRGGHLDLDKNLMKDDDDTKAALGPPSRLDVAALHASLKLQKM
jgi:hypothetical protein